MAIPTAPAQPVHHLAIVRQILPNSNQIDVLQVNYVNFTHAGQGVVCWALFTPYNGLGVHGVPSLDS